MNPSKQASRANKVHKGIRPDAPRRSFKPKFKLKFRLATYPLLGILLVLVPAVLVYGGLLFLFLD